MIWGDAKAANILIDVRNDPWSIDFGGSYTPGWVENDIAGTVEGDKQGLRADKREVSQRLLSYSSSENTATDKCTPVHESERMLR